LSSDFPTVLILAGGLGTRLGQTFAAQPKAMVPVAGMPFIAHQLRLLKREKVARVVISVAHMSDQIKQYVGDGDKFGLSVLYSHDGPTRLGTGGAIKKALPLLPEEFAVMYGDTYLDINFAPIYAEFHQKKRSALVTVLANSNKWDKSNMLREGGAIIAYDKVSPSPEMQHIDYGLSILKKECLEEFSDEKPFDMSALFQKLIAAGQMSGYEVTQRFYEIGTPESLAETEQYLLSSQQRK
jgi:NDP-sugar pyrophosphorylase family protein